MKPAFLALRPRLFWRPGERYPLVSPELRDASPALAEDFGILERELLPDFYELDEGALQAQNTFRLTQIFVIVGGATTTLLGAVQAALGGGVTEIGIAEALVAGMLAAAVAYVRGRQAQREYFTTRLKAEQLRSEYFLFLARVPPYDMDDDDERLRGLRDQVSKIGAEESA
jgi:Protein of unknown function (DUF4231)